MANFNLNKVILGGRLTAKPELKTTPSGVAVTTFSMAINRRGKDDAVDFINVTAWRGTAEFITKFFDKGSSICIVGSVQTRSWTDNNGNKRYATDIVAEEAYFVDSKSDKASESRTEANDSPAVIPGIGQPTYMPEAYKEAQAALSDDEDLPF